MYSFSIHPEVAGNISKSNFIDRSARPPKIAELKYQFDGWLGDDLLESICTFIVTEQLMSSIKNSQLSGIAFKDVEIFPSEKFREIYGEKQLPKFYWMQIVGKLGEADFAMSEKHRLVISAEALAVLTKFQISNADIEPYE
ncbi:MAG TPA: hypothetical protein VIM75_14480 [Ohtaekwangia sp.]|uniref:hypothetical protein n=1 Tax=Ohtaekwangia sp. TaxID=2066019 RepID=UPI002F92B27B